MDHQSEVEKIVLDKLQEAADNLRDSADALSCIEGSDAGVFILRTLKEQLEKWIEEGRKC